MDYAFIDIQDYAFIDISTLYGPSAFTYDWEKQSKTVRGNLKAKLCPRLSISREDMCYLFSPSFLAPFLSAILRSSSK